MSFLGYIKLDRKIKNWEWYKDKNAKSLFIHCLLSANFEDRLYKGTVVNRGSFLCSNQTLMDDLDMTRQEIRTAISKLEKTGEITVVASNQGTRIFVNNWEEYQENNGQFNNKISTNEQPTNYDVFEPVKQPTENGGLNHLNSGLFDDLTEPINQRNNQQATSDFHTTVTTNNNKEDIRYIDIDKEDKGAKRNEFIEFILDNIEKKFLITSDVEVELIRTYNLIWNTFGRNEIINHLNYIVREVNRNSIASVQSYLLTSATNQYNRLSVTKEI